MTSDVAPSGPVEIESKPAADNSPKTGLASQVRIVFMSAHGKGRRGQRAAAKRRNRTRNKLASASRKRNR